MSVTALVDSLLGLCLVYLLTCGLCSGLQEMLARWRGRRGHFLREGLNSLVTDRWIYLRVLNHPLIVSLYRAKPGVSSPPSYMPSRLFAEALVDTILQWKAPSPHLDGRTLDDLKAAIARARRDAFSVGHGLWPLVEGAPTLEAAIRNIENWYESGMERVGGAFRAETRKSLFLVGVVVAIAFNIDSISIASTLARSDALRDAARAEATALIEAGAASPATARDDLTRLASSGLPFGYACLNTPPGNPTMETVAGCRDALFATSINAMLLKLAGFLLTGLAASLGSPFWFDLMSKVSRVRIAGAKPHAPAAPQT